jgi:hypothetical protein
MSKPILLFSSFGVVMAMLHGFFSFYFPALGSKIYITAHFVIFMLTLFTIFSVELTAKLTKILPAFIFLGQSLLKVILGGCFFIFALRFLEKKEEAAFMIFFISLYFLYMIIELILVIKSLKKQA